MIVRLLLANDFTVNTVYLLLFMVACNECSNLPIQVDKRGMQTELNDTIQIPVGANDVCYPFNFCH